MLEPFLPFRKLASTDCLIPILRANSVPVISFAEILLFASARTISAFAMKPICKNISHGYGIHLWI